VSRYLELCTLGDPLVRGSEHHPGRDALVLPGVRLSYRELAERATGVARSLAAMGVARGDRVGLFMPNGPEFIESLFGIVFAGEPRTRADVIAEALGPDLTAVVALGPALRPAGGMLSQEAFGQLAELVPAEAVEARRRGVALRDPAIMFYTSGTTAMPKGCVLSHEAQVRTGVATRLRLGYADGERVFAPCPMFHTASTQPMVATLHAFGTFVSMAHFDPAPALKLIEAERVTAMFPAFPPLTLSMLNSPDYSPGSFARVRTVFTVAPPEALRAMQRRMPHSTLVNAYGMTEFGGSVVMVDPADGDDARLATQGPPFPGLEIGIRDEANRPLPAGERGEIVIRGPSMFAGYHGGPAGPGPAEAIDADGWYHSGDLGFVGTDGRLRYLGRLKDMLKVGGENVATLEIASHLHAHPAVSVAQVVGVADEKYGEVPAAFIELQPGAALSEEEVIVHCRAGLATFKVPRHVRFVTQWPMSSTKVQTFRLREQLEAELAARRAGQVPR
jgi:fatty-acyl-CoA synthase